MALVQQASGSQACTLDTEHTLATRTDGKTYVLLLDLNPIVGGTSPDILIVRAKVKVLTGSTARQVYSATYVGGLLADKVAISVPIPAVHEVSFSIEQTDGTGRTIDWSVVSLD